ncbi:MAG: glycosyltransferase family 9 protein [Halanaerobiaceae bacterium]|nr:glycosyltransferase family 9 protein [Halanaerobiaceae bacterium]
MKELLIIRSVSFQQLDKNIVAIKEEFKDYNINLLTHEHGVKLAEKYKWIKNIYTYPYKDSFKYRNKVNELKDKRFEIVIIPVTNITGAGFLNVLNYSLSIKARKRIICNVVSELKEVNIPQILFMNMKSILISVVSLICTFISSLIIGLFLPIFLFFIKKEDIN